MHPFEDLAQVQSTLQRLAQREPPIVTILPRQPGTKESRYSHLLSGAVVETHAPGVPVESPSARNALEATRIAQIENEVAGLQKEVASLKEQFATFRKQFE
jgi:hypothetical protein